MSNPDSFINEVTEEVRRDRVYAALRRYGWIAVLLIVLVVGGAAANEWRKARAQAAAEVFGDALLDALGRDDEAARMAALDAIEAEGAQAALVRFLAAIQAAEMEDTARAVALLDAVAGDNALPASYRQLAMIKRVAVGAAVLPIDERRAAMEQLAAPGQAFRPLAMEQLALLDIEAGARDRAIERLRALLDEPQTTPALRQRASQAIVALGADLSAE